MRKLLSLVLVLTLVLGAAAAAEGRRIAFVPTALDDVLCQAMEAPIREAVEASGDTLVEIDPQGDQATMTLLVRDLLKEPLDLLLLVPVQPNMCKTIQRDCAKAGVPVVNLEPLVTPRINIAASVTVDNYAAGAETAGIMVSRLPEGAKVAVIHNPADSACVDFADGFYDAVGDALDIVIELNGGGTARKSKAQAELALRDIPGLAALFCAGDRATVGAAEALDEFPEKDVMIFGMAVSPEGRQMIAEGRLTGAFTWSPAEVGRLAIETGYRLLAGEAVEKALLVPAVCVDADNVADYDAEGWL